MIYLYSGTPGSGKSLHQAMDIYNYLCYGKPVIANFEINVDAVSKSKLSKSKGIFRYVPNDELTPEFLRSFSDWYFETTGKPRREGAIKVYIDEAQLLFNARSWNAKGREDWNSFFTNHRKYFMDIYLVAQFDRMLDRQVRSLIEYEVIHRKMANFGWKGQFLSLVMGGRVFIAVKRWYPLKERLGSEVIRCRKKWLNIYDTYKTFDNADKPSKHKALNEAEAVVEVADAVSTVAEVVGELV